MGKEDFNGVHLSIFQEYSGSNSWCIYHSNMHTSMGRWILQMHLIFHFMPLLFPFIWFSPLESYSSREFFMIKFMLTQAKYSLPSIFIPACVQLYHCSYRIIICLFPKLVLLIFFPSTWHSTRHIIGGWIHKWMNDGLGHIYQAVHSITGCVSVLYEATRENRNPKPHLLTIRRSQQYLYYKRNVVMLWSKL